MKIYIYIYSSTQATSTQTHSNNYGTPSNKTHTQTYTQKNNTEKPSTYWIQGYYYRPCLRAIPKTNNLQGTPPLNSLAVASGFLKYPQFVQNAARAFLRPCCPSLGSRGPRHWANWCHLVSTKNVIFDLFVVTGMVQYQG